MILESKIWTHCPNRRIDDSAIASGAGGELGVRWIARMATFALGSLLLTILFTNCGLGEADGMDGTRHGNGWLGFSFDTFRAEIRPWPFATICFNTCNSMRVWS
jgi:hypothetical protein